MHEQLRHGAPRQRPARQGISKFPMELDFQGIVDLVGGKLREVLHTQDIGIRWYDHETNLVHYLYEVEHGKPAPDVYIAAAMDRETKILLVNSRGSTAQEHREILNELFSLFLKPRVACPIVEHSN